MIKYKLTDQDCKTYNNTLWGENVTHESNGEGKLCSSGWLHYYHSPLLAVLLNPIYGNIINPKLWECEAEGKHLDDCGLKGGCTKLTTIKEINLPEVTFEQRVRFAVLCVKQVYKDEKWNEWADRWLSGEDRTVKTAADITDATRSVAIRSVFKAPWSAVDAACCAARSAAYSDICSTADAAFSAARSADVFSDFDLQFIAELSVV